MGSREIRISILLVYFCRRRYLSMQRQ